MNAARSGPLVVERNECAGCPVLRRGFKGTSRATSAAMFKSMCGELWVVVLAGGEGARLGDLTRALYGDERPKQFAVLSGHRSLLQETVERATQLVPLERIIVIVTAHHRELASAQLAPYPGIELLVQPRNLDTGPGLLLPLTHIHARGPEARVVFLPSDHHVTDAHPLLAAIARSAHGTTRDRITLLGVSPDNAETEYGWITRGQALHHGDHARTFEVRRFVEKPEEALARRLHRRGALWNTFISTGPVEAYWTLAHRYLPVHMARFAEYSGSIGTSSEAAALEAAYARMPKANFSKEVLSHAHHLVVMPVIGSGWSDWGSPTRVFRSLSGTPQHATLLARIHEQALAGL